MADRDRIPELAPSRLPRQQRRHVDRALRKFMQRDRCSICGSPFQCNSFGGFDTQGNVALVGECCINRVPTVFSLGLIVTGEQLDAAYQKAQTNKILDNAERCGGLGRPSEVNWTDSPWKNDDRVWFEKNPSRAHRLRPPFPGEMDETAAETPAGCELLVLVRQVEPGSRMRAGLHFGVDWLPLPDHEAVAHALFEVAVRREPWPRDGAALCALLEKYMTPADRSAFTAGNAS
jgi:hypothetical protein